MFCLDLGSRFKEDMRRNVVGKGLLRKGGEGMTKRMWERG